MELTAKFKQRYLPGFDCRLSTFRNTLAVSDIVLSNSMIFGLSGTFMFCFNDNEYYSRLPYFVVTEVNDQSLENLTFNLNLYLFRGRMYNIIEAKKEISKLLSMGLPVNIAINRLLLQEICGESTNQINMGHHYITVTEYNKEKDNFIVFETDKSEEIALTSEELNSIWFSDLVNKRDQIDPFQLCDGQWYTAKSSFLSHDDLIKSCYSGIRKVLTNFFQSPIPEIMGKEALNNFANKISHLESISDTNYAKTSIQILNAMESGMSGGGLGRKLFSYFLSEFSRLTNCNEVKDISLGYTELAGLWRNLVKTLTSYFHTTNDTGIEVSYKSIIEQTKEIESLEIKYMTDLKEWFEKTSFKC